MPDTFRCSVASETDAEPLAGTAPTETDWLLLERPGAWGRQAVSDSGLPDEVVAHLDARPARVQLLRRHGSGSGGAPGVRVFTASLGATVEVRSAVLDDVRDVLDVTDADLTPYGGPLWLVCANGRRDVCCAERGRPVAAALLELGGVDAEGTWETTHLGGHRFAATLLALPSGVALGRLDATAAVAAAQALAQGRMPLGVTRGRAGWPPVAQHADLHLRRQHGWTALDDVALVGRIHPAGPVPVGGGAGRRVHVFLDTPDGAARVTVTDLPGPARRQSCADLSEKGTRLLGVEQVEWAPQRSS